MEKPTIIITGGTGFIGSHTCVELMNSYNLIVIDNLLNSKKEVIDKIKQITQKDNIQFYNFDLLDKKQLDIIFQKYNPYGVIHFAGLKAVGESVKKPCYYYQNNLITTLNLLEVMEKNNCFKLIFSSSATVYGSQKSPLKEDFTIGQNVTNPYGQTKAMIEQILKDMCVSNNKWNIVSLRYFNPVGAHRSGLIGENPNDIPNNLMPYVLKVAINNNTTFNLGEQFNHLKIFGNDYKTYDGTGERDFIHVVDLAKGHVSALNKMVDFNGYNVFNLGTGNPTSVLELVKTFENSNNVKIPFVYTERRQGDLDICFCDPEYTYRILNWKTEKTIEDMCRDAWYFQKLNPTGF
jgi:UDP-glucose 4-epimerase